MRTLSWNCHGLGAPRVVRACKKVIRSRHPNVVFLMESKLKVREAEKLNQSLGFKNAIWVDCTGDSRRSGGLGLLWDEDLEVELLSYSQNHINVQVKEALEEKVWRFTGFCGYLEESNKNLSWYLLLMLKNKSNLPWLCGLQ